MFKQIDHIALHVKDITLSQKFYCQYFDFKHHFSETIPSGTHICYLTLNNTMLELAEIPGQMISGVHFCLSTDHFSQAFNHLKSQGLKVARTHHPTSARSYNETNWQRAVFLGPDQEQVEIRGPN